MCRLLKNILLFVALALVSILIAPKIAVANGFVDAATIQNIQIIDAGSGALFVLLDTAIAGTPPSCANPSSGFKRFVVSPTTANGQVIVSGLLAVHGEGRKVQIGGKGVCDVWGDTETISYILTE